MNKIPRRYFGSRFKPYKGSCERPNLPKHLFNCYIFINIMKIIKLKGIFSYNNKIMPEEYLKSAQEFAKLALNSKEPSVIIQNALYRPILICLKDHF